MTLPLYELVRQRRELALMADSDELDPDALRDTLEGLDGSIEDKARAVGAVSKTLDASAEAIENEANAMLERAKRLRTRAENVRTYLLTNMQAAGISKIESPWFVLAIRKNPPRVEISDESKIPDEFRDWPEPPPPRINKTRLAQALKAGATIEGATLAQSERLEIRS